MSKTEIVTPETQRREPRKIETSEEAFVKRADRRVSHPVDPFIQFGRYNEITTANRLGLDAYGA